MAQTPRQRQANAKFFKEQEQRRGKSEDEIKKLVKDVKATKSPISGFWLAILGFVVFGGLIFEVLSRLFGQ
jgi:hypothetical protein